LAALKFLGYLADIVGTREKKVVLDKPTLLREMLPSSFPENDIIVIIDKKAGNLDSLVENKDSVIIMPVISGG